MGIPGAGKSSIFRLLAADREIISYHEPEEEEWSAAVLDREACGRFTAISWFRSQRVPMLFEADKTRTSGRPALVDSYFDKLLGSYLEHPAMAWLIAPDDPYFHVTSQLAKIDREFLPDADVLVFFEVEKGIWERNLDLRGRAMDGEVEFRNRCFNMQKPFLDACIEYCGDTGAQLVRFDQRADENLSQATVRLGTRLEEVSVFAPSGEAK